MSQRRYRRPGSPVGGSRSIVAPWRSSTGTLGYPPYDPYYPPSPINREIRPSPRSSSDRFPEPPGAAPLGAAPRAYPVDLPPRAHYAPAYPRPRRATLDQDLQPRRPIITTGPPGGRLGEANGALVRTVDSDVDADDYYLAPGTSSRRHRRNVSADEGDWDRRDLDRARRDPGPGRLIESGGYRSPTGHARRQVYQYPAPEGRPVGEDPRSRHGDPSYRGPPRSRTARDDPYLEPTPRRRRADSLDTGRRPRPMSMSVVELGEHLPRLPVARDARPPPSTRGFDRLPPPSTIVTSPTGYEPSRSPREADRARDERRHGRGPPVLVHQEPVGAHARPSGDWEDHRSDDERGPRRRHAHHRHHHGVDVDPRMALVVAGAGAGPTAAAPRNHRTPDASLDDRPDGESVDGDAHRHRHHHRSDRHASRRHRPHDATASDSDSTPPARGSRDDDRRRRRHRDRAGHEGSRRGPPLPTPAELRASEEHRYRPDHGTVVAAEAALVGVNGAAHRSRRDDDDNDDDDARAPERDRRASRRSRRHDAESSADDDDADDDDDRDDERRSHRASRRRTREEAEMVRAGDDRPHTSHGSEVRVVSPPRTKEPPGPLKGILREPRDHFPEDPAPVREGVAPLKEALKDGRKGIPPGARWTKIDRRRVNPAALEEAKERFEERSDHVIVLRVLTRDEIEALAVRTQKLRGRWWAIDAVAHAPPPVVASLTSIDVAADARERRHRDRRSSHDADPPADRAQDRRDSGSSSMAAGPTSDSDREIIYERNAAPTSTPE